MLYGVDVHGQYQRGINFATLKKQGYSFASVKLTQGTAFLAPQAVAYVKAARAAGLVPGGYHWLNGADGAEQARWFHRQVVAAGGPEGMLIQLDIEDNTVTWPVVKAWVAQWRTLAPGHPFLIYTGKWWWDVPARKWAGATLTPHLWHSHYLEADADTTPDNPAAFAARIPASWWAPNYGGWANCTFLQFSSKGDAGGLGNNVDLDVTKLTMPELLKLTTAKVAPPPAPPAPPTPPPAPPTPPTPGAHVPLTTAEIAAIARAVHEYDIDPGSTSQGAGAAVWDLRLRLAALEASIAALPATSEIRDAVADLGEGGSAAVRADV